MPSTPLERWYNPNTPVALPFLQRLLSPIGDALTPDSARRLGESRCVPSSNCDPAGPQDQLCDPTLPAGAECKDAHWPDCLPYARGPALSYCALRR